QSERPGLLDQRQLGLAGLVPACDVRSDPLGDELAHGGLDVPFLVGQQVIDPEQLQRADSHDPSFPASSPAALTISSSCSSTCRAACPSGTKLSALATRPIGPVQPASTRAVITPSP